VAEQLANSAASTLTAAIPDAVATSCTVANGTVFPASGNFRIIIDSELMLCTARSGNTLTVTRGAEATTAVAHSNGAAVTHVLTKAGLDQYIVERNREIAYQEFTASVIVSSTSEAAPNDVVSSGSIVFDGSTTVVIEFFSPLVQPGAAAGSTLICSLWDSTTDLGRMSYSLNPSATNPASGPVSCQRRLIPTATTHIYKIRAFAAGANGTIFAGAGGATVFLPGFIRITRA
jgi:hypothetical protein